MSAHAPIFVVGAPRSGTTLLAAMLSAHPDVDCGPESHFFSKTSREERLAAISSRDWPETGVRLIESLTINGESVARAFGIDTEECRRYLDARDPSEQAMLESLTSQSAQQHRKSIWVEKTPNHLLYITDIQCVYPDARFVHIIRDPRDVAMSMRKLPWTSNTILANAYLWTTWHLQSKENWQNNPKVLQVRYEDLVAEPARELERLCSELSISFETAMLDTTRSGDRLAVKGEVWKSQVSKPLDPSRTAVWKREFPSELLPAAELVTHELLEHFGYDYSHAPRSTAWLSPCTRQFVENNERLIVEEASRGHRFLPAADLTEYERLAAPDEPLLLTQPIRLGSSSTTRAKRLGKTMLQLARLRLNGRRVKHIDSFNDRQCSGGVADRLGRTAVRLLSPPAPLGSSSNVKNG